MDCAFTDFLTPLRQFAFLANRSHERHGKPQKKVEREKQNKKRRRLKFGLFCVHPGEFWNSEFSVYNRFIVIPRRSRRLSVMASGNCELMFTTR
jgi:hypothetical protein